MRNVDGKKTAESRNMTAERTQTGILSGVTTSVGHGLAHLGGHENPASSGFYGIVGAWRAT